MLPRRRRSSSGSSTGRRVTKILSTHHHPDHTMANPELAAHFGVPVFGHSPTRVGLPGFTDGVDEGDTVAVGRRDGPRALHPRAHAGDVAYVFDEAGALFCGDTLFAAGCGRLFEGTRGDDVRGPLPASSTPCRTTRASTAATSTPRATSRSRSTSSPTTRPFGERLERVRAIRAAGGRRLARRHARGDDRSPPRSARRRERIPSCVPADAAELGRIRRLKDSF